MAGRGVDMFPAPGQEGMKQLGRELGERRKLIQLLAVIINKSVYEHFVHLKTVSLPSVSTRKRNRQSHVKELKTLWQTNTCRYLKSLSLLITATTIVIVNIWF